MILALLPACGSAPSSPAPDPCIRHLAGTPAVPATKGHWTTTGGVTRWHPGTPGVPAKPGPELCASSCDPGEGEPVAACPEVGLVGCCDFGATYTCDYAPTSEAEAKRECIGGAWATRVP